MVNRLPIYNSEHFQLSQDNRTLTVVKAKKGHEGCYTLQVINKPPHTGKLICYRKLNIKLKKLPDLSEILIQRPRISIWTKNTNKEISRNDPESLNSEGLFVDPGKKVFRMILIVYFPSLFHQPTPPYTDLLHTIS